MFSFAGLDESFDNSRVVVSPVSSDVDSDRSVTAIIEASGNLELYEEETDAEAYKIGIHTFKQFKSHENPESFMTALYEHAKQLLANDKFSCVIGGSHSVSLPFIRAHNEKYYDMSVLQIDAQANLCEKSAVDQFASNSVMTQVIKEMRIPSVQVGIRSISVQEAYSLDEHLPTKIFWARDMAENSRWTDEAVSHLTENVYLTIDVSGFDPSLVSTSGAAHPGGLGWYETLDLIRKTAERHRIVGMDLVEYAYFDAQKSAAFLCAKLIYKTLAYIFNGDTIKVRKH